MGHLSTFFSLNYRDFLSAKQLGTDTVLVSVMPALKRTRLTASAWGRQTGVSTVC